MQRKKPVVEQNRQYTIKEVCCLLDICRDTVRKYTKNETIVCIRITAREIYYLGSEILILWETLTKSQSLQCPK